jgi:hypothetical protein
MLPKFNLISQNIELSINEYAYSGDSLALTFELSNSKSGRVCVWLPIEASCSSVLNSSMSIVERDTLFYKVNIEGVENKSKTSSTGEEVKIVSFVGKKESSLLRRSSSLEFKMLFDDIELLPKVVVVPIKLSFKKEEEVRLLYVKFK